MRVRRKNSRATCPNRSRRAGIASGGRSAKAPARALCKTVPCLTMTGGYTLSGRGTAALRYFVAVAEMENVSRAAMQRLHVSQPSLSRQIRDLEDELGVQLLERTAKSVRLTEAGRAFLDEARAILKQTDDAVRKVRAIAGKGDAELHIGDWPLATGGLMPALLRAYHDAMPGVGVKLHDWPVEKNIAAVRDGRLQLALLAPPLKANALDELRFEQLITVRVCLAVPCDHPFAKKRSVALAEAAREPFIGLTHEEYPRYEEYLAAIFARVNDKPRVVEEQDGWSGVFSAVSSGAGVAITSDAFSYPSSDRIKLVRLTPEPKRVAIGILSRKGKLSVAAEKFCECAKQAFATSG